MERNEIRTAVEALLPDAESLLCSLIRLPSLPGEEADAVAFAQKAFSRLGLKVTQVPLSEALRDDPDYSSPAPIKAYDGRYNLRVQLPGSGNGKSLLFNSHLDTVPPSQGQEAPFDPQVRDGVVYGRGACDAKGQVTTIYLVMATLKKLGVKLGGDVLAHVVNEEEVGGNGTLAMIRTGEKADAAVILEPTTNRIYSSVRGAVWFRITCTGKAGHSGRAGDTMSALTLARKTMDILEGYHAELLAASKGIPLFDKYENPMPLTFGRCQAGDWPATAPSRAVIEGVLGFLPNRTRGQIISEMRAAIAADPMLKDRVQIDFSYRHDCHVLDPDHELVRTLFDCGREWELPIEIDAMTASCDSWFYQNQLSIPSVVYGPGTLGFAHSNEEQIQLADIAESACVLVDFVCRWAGSQG